MAYFNEDVQVVKSLLVNLGADETGSGTITDLNSNGKSFCRVTAATTINSIVAVPDKTFNILNATGSVLTIKNDTGSTAANKILTGRNGDLLLPPDGTASFYYDNTAARWRCIADNTPPLTQTTFVVGGTSTVHTVDTSIDYARAGIWTLSLNAQTNVSGSLTYIATFGYNSGNFFSQSNSLAGLATLAFSNNGGKVRVTITTLLGNSTFNVVGSCAGQYS